MTDEDRKIMRDEITVSVKAAVKEMVNGKLDPNSPTFAMKDIYQHMEETRPLLEAYKGSKMLGELIKWLGGIALAWLAFKNVLHL